MLVAVLVVAGLAAGSRMGDNPGREWHDPRLLRNVGQEPAGRRLGQLRKGEAPVSWSQNAIQGPRARRGPRGTRETRVRKGFPG